ncbi:MAG: 1,4-dihydroxy-2-naphthoate octaprenyltransferase [Armatimonadota bacterium]|nr:1,4-dihydroxy-2-naphthoate octaprenyltransferase [Armatimonadota bacterium]MCX7777271.1 1,4-dihydroxy-2-naphthoate octaprenyltransferase [Armatimonadota bacterium]MDW8024685.1 1,4-dihydroxy-2-naphthoate octaprenyltransferase [Armatimonadota bacterium]
MPNAVIRFMQIVRAPFFTATISPVLMGTALAWRLEGKFDIVLFLMALLAMLFLHAAANMLNDYFDHLSGTDWLANPIRLSAVASLTGGGRAIQDGIVQPQEMLLYGLSSLLIGISLGIWLVVLVGLPLLLIGALGAFFAFFYTAPPIKLAHRGLGEFAVGMSFGVLSVLGSYFVQTGNLDWRVALASLPVASLITAVLWVNEIPDAPYDKAVGKLNLVVRLGVKGAAFGYFVLVAFAYIVLPFISLSLSSPVPLIGLLTLPMAFVAALNVRWYACGKRSVVEAMSVACPLTITTHIAMGILLTIAYAV